MELFTVDAKIRLDISELENGIRSVRNELRDIEDDITAKVGLNTDDFDSAYADISEELDKIRAGATASIGFDDVDTTVIDDAQSKVDTFDKGATAELDVSDVDTENLDDAQGKINVFDNGATADLGISNIDTAGVDTAQGKIDAFDEGATAELSTNTDGIDTSTIESAQGELEKFDDTFTADANTDDSGVDTGTVENAQDVLDDFATDYTANAEVIDNASEALGGITSAADEATDAVGGDNGLLGTLTGMDILKGLTFAGIIAGIGMITDSAWEAVMAVAQIGDTIDKQSQMVGMSADAYQQWSYVLSRNGADASVLKAITRNLTTNYENEDFNKYLRQLGYRNTNKFRSMSTEDQVKELVTKLIDARKDMDDTSFAQMAETMLGARAYQQLMPLFNAGRKNKEGTGFDDLWEFAGQNLMSEEAVKNSAALTDAITSLDTAWGNLKNTVIGELVLPEITDFVNDVADLVSSIRTAVDNNYSLYGILFGIDDGGMDRVDALTDAYYGDLAKAETDASRARVLTDALARMETEMGSLAQETEAWKTTLGELEKIYPDITEIINANNGSFVQGKEDIYAYIEAQKALAIYSAKEKALQAYSDAYTNEMAKVFEYQSRQQIALAEMQSVIDTGTTGYNGTAEQAMADLAFYRENIGALTPKYDRNKPGGWDYTYVDMFLERYGKDEEWLTAISKLNQQGFDPYRDYYRYGESAKNAEEAAQYALKLYEDMSVLVESQMNEALSSVGATTTSVDDLGTAAANAAEKLNAVDGSDPGHANGIWNVNENGMYAKLHQGEAVLTRLEADRWRNGRNGGGYVDATANLNIGNYNVYGSTDEKSLVAALVAEQRNQLRAVGERV